MDIILQEVSTDPRDRRSPRRCWTSTGCGGRRRSTARTGSSRRSGTGSRIYYKYEGGSPAGSHKPNTAVPQAFYSAQGRPQAPRDRDRRRPVGVARSRFACQVFGLECKVYMVRRQLRAEAVPPGDDGDVGRRRRPQPVARHQRRPRRSSRPDPDSPGSLGIAISEAVEDAADARRHQLLAGLRAEPRADAPDGDRPGGAASSSRWPARRASTSSSAASAAARTSAAWRCPFVARQDRRAPTSRSSPASRPPARR